MTVSGSTSTTVLWDQQVQTLLRSVSLTFYSTYERSSPFHLHCDDVSQKRPVLPLLIVTHLRVKRRWSRKQDVDVRFHELESLETWIGRTKSSIRTQRRKSSLLGLQMLNSWNNQYIQSRVLIIVAFLIAFYDKKKKNTSVVFIGHRFKDRFTFHLF